MNDTGTGTGGPAILLYAPHDGAIDPGNITRLHNAGLTVAVVVGKCPAERRVMLTRGAGQSWLEVQRDLACAGYHDLVRKAAQRLMLGSIQGDNFSIITRETRLWKFPFLKQGTVSERGKQGV